MSSKMASKELQARCRIRKLTLMFFWKDEPPPTAYCALRSSLPLGNSLCIVLTQSELAQVSRRTVGWHIAYIKLISVAERLSESAHIVDHDPSLALYRLQVCICIYIYITSQ